ncbi:MAG: hypothetical protein WC073_02115 [Sterolibacterium sp.]
MERSALIRKIPNELRVAPNLDDYAKAHKAFSWDEIRQGLEGLPGGGCNIAYEAVDRHAAGAIRERTAFRFLGHADASGTIPMRDITYAELFRLTCRFTNVLRRLGMAWATGCLSSRNGALNSTNELATLNDLVGYLRQRCPA